VPKLGRKSKIGLIAVVVLALLLIGALFFPVPQPDVHLSANYGTSDHVPDPFFKLGPIYFTNTLITSLISVLVLIGLFYFGTRKMKLVPSGLQNFCEALIQLMLDFVEGVAGKEKARVFLPVCGTIFLYVLTNAWMGLIPIYNIFGWGHDGATDTLLSSIAGSVFPSYEGFIVKTAVLRPANTDVNVPLMLAIVSFISVEYWGISALGLRQYGGKFFRYGQFFGALGQLVRGKVKSAFSGLFYGAIDIFVGGLELLSEFVRIISFTFRLFGNMTAGEVLLLMMAFLIPWVIPVVFYGLETLLGAIQALIFGGLTLVFATLAVMPHEHENEHEHEQKPEGGL